MRSTNLKRVFYTHFTLWRLSNNLLLNSSVGLNVISSVRHPTQDIHRQYRVPSTVLINRRPQPPTLTFFVVDYFNVFNVFDVVFRSRRCRCRYKEKEKEKERVWFMIVGMFGCQTRHQFWIARKKKKKEQGRRYMRDSKTNKTRHG